MALIATHTQLLAINVAPTVVRQIATTESIRSLKVGLVEKLNR